MADGSFDGYSSWAEKPFNRLIWSRLERARTYASTGDVNAGFEDRIRLLSTPHFGLSSPVLNITREQTALELSSKMERKACAALPSDNDDVKASFSFKSFLAPLKVRAFRKLVGLYSAQSITMDILSAIVIYYAGSYS